METKIQVILFALLGILLALVVTTNAAGCTPMPCKMNSTCEEIKKDEKVADYKCACLPGYMGKTCSEKIEPCMPDPCQRGAKCTVVGLGLKVKDFSCDCSMWWTAQDCSRHDVSLTILVATCVLVVAVVLFVIISVICNRRKMAKKQNDEQLNLS